MTPFRRWLAMLCALLGAAALALAVQGAPWWRIGDEVGIGTVASRHCFGAGGCEQGTLAWTNGSDTWVRAGNATYGGGLVAALVLVTLAGALAARSSGRLPGMSAAVATVATAVVGAIFVSTRPALPGTAIGYGLPLFLAGLVLAATAVAATLWRGRPRTPR
ncbi:MAG TPA: hypothetical protein VHE35_22140 [Kofleriaceae bacterium]|nr:hypothetical protein [Kofleriaceae bacterium]